MTPTMPKVTIFLETITHLKNGDSMLVLSTPVLKSSRFLIVNHMLTSIAPH